MQNKISIITGQAGSGKTKFIRKFLSDSGVSNISIFDTMENYSEIKNKEDRNINVYNYPFLVNYNDFPFEDFMGNVKNAIEKGDKILIDEAYFFLKRNEEKERTQELLNYLTENPSKFLLVFQDEVQVNFTALKNIDIKIIDIKDIENETLFNPNETLTQIERENRTGVSWFANFMNN